MIELIDALPSGTLGFRCSGRITGEEMQRLVIPPIEAALLEFDHIKALVVLEPSFEGLSLEAAWDDTSLGLRHWDGFERLAVVTDLGWARHGMRAMAVLLPCPVHLFPRAEQDNARRWLSESLGTVHIDRQGEVITISLIGHVDQHDGRGAELRQPSHMGEDDLIVRGVLERHENATVHQAIHPRMVWKSSQIFSVAMTPATTYAAMRSPTEFTNSPIFSRSEVKRTRGNTANESCSDRMT
jgi:hypothetical protein